MSNTNNAVKEVVLYKLKPAYVKGYAEKLLPLLQDFLTSQKGFLNHQALSAIKQEGYMMDLVEWENLASAEAASAEWEKRTKQEGDLSGMTAAFEKVEFFDHFKSIL